MQKLVAIFRPLGFALLAALAVLIVFTLLHQPERPDLQILEDTHAFSGNAQLPQAEIQKQLNAARDVMEKRLHYSEVARYTSMGADWLAFLLTAFITLLAGYHGRSMAVASPTDPAIADLVKGASSRFTRTVGLTAACAAICTGISAKAKDVSTEFYDDASTIQAAAMNARAEIPKAIDANAAQDILDKLAQTLAKH